MSVRACAAVAVTVLAAGLTAALTAPGRAALPAGELVEVRFGVTADGRQEIVLRIGDDSAGAPAETVVATARKATLDTRPSACPDSATADRSRRIVPRTAFPPGPHARTFRVALPAGIYLVCVYRGGDGTLLRSHAVVGGRERVGAGATAGGPALGRFGLRIAGTTVTVQGAVSGASTARIVLQRRQGGGWATLASAVARGGTYTVSAPRSPGAVVRVAVVDAAGAVVDASPPIPLG